MEIEVLRGAKNILKSNDIDLIIECSTYVNDMRNAIYDLLTETYGYEVYKLNPGKKRPSTLIKVSSRNELPKHDNIVCMKE